MSIGNICRKETITINEESSLKEAAELMEKENVGFIVVKSTTSNKPTGILTDRDIVTRAIAKNTNIENIKVRDVMERDLLTLTSNQGIKEIIKSMSEKGVRRAPIIDNDQIIGIVSIDDLIAMLADELNDIANLIKKQIY